MFSWTLQVHTYSRGIRIVKVSKEEVSEMEKKTMKKYRIAVGICGPRVVYSNIIKAHSK